MRAPGGRARTWLWTWSLACVVGLCAGCAGGAQDEVPADAAVQDTSEATARLPLRVTVQQGRLAATRGQIQFGFEPVAGASLDIAALQLRDPRFAEVPPTPRVTTVDRLLHVALDIGEAICTAAVGDPPQAAITVPGTPEPLLAPIDAPGDEVLAGLHEAACDRAAVLDAADVGFGADWRSVGHATARGTLEVRRRGSQAPLTVAQVQGTVIFTLEVLEVPGADVVGRLPRGDALLEIPVEVSAARCDAHALAESKKTFLFPTWVGLGDAEPVFLAVEPHGETRTVFEELMTVGCGLS